MNERRVEGTEMRLLPEIERRRSVRKYTGKVIDRCELESIVEAGRLAPSAKNRQAWRFIVIDDQKVKERIQEAAFGQEHVGNAGAVIALCTTNVDYRMPNGQLSYGIDISIAASFMMLQAEHSGLGTCVMSTYDEQEVKNILTVPYSMRIPLLLLVGYPEERQRLLDRYPIERITSYNHW